MVGASVKERLENTMIHGCVMDLRTQMFKVCTNKEKYLEDKDKMLAENCVPKLDKLEKHCGEFVNGKLTYIDFFLYECLIFLSKVDGALVAKYPKLCAMMKRFTELKGVKEIVASEDFKKMNFMPAVYIHESIENH
jgi:glutathione S-transferase